jgi:hypothetical protein
MKVKKKGKTNKQTRKKTQTTTKKLNVKEINRRDNVLFNSKLNRQ